MKKHSKIFCAILTVCMMLTVLPLGAFATNDKPVNFTDIGNSKLQNYILYWSNEPVKNSDSVSYVAAGYSDGTFKPNDNITRGAAAAILSRAYGYDSTGKITAFSDVAKSNNFYNNIMACAEKGVIKGYEDGSFRPANNIKRQEAIAMIARCAGDTFAKYKASKTNTEFKQFLDKTFKDSSDISQVFYAEFCFLKEFGNLEGWPDGTVRPTQYITRAQFVKLLYSIVNGNSEPIVPGKVYQMDISISDGKNTVNDSAKMLTSKSAFVAEFMKLVIADRALLKAKFPVDDMQNLLDSCIAKYNELSKDGWTADEETTWKAFIKDNFGTAVATKSLADAAVAPNAPLSALSCDTYTATIKDRAGTQYTVTVTITEKAY